MNLTKLFTCCALLLASHTLSAQTVGLVPPEGKEIYIPRDLRNNDFTSSDSKWSYARMAYTDDVIVFWEKPFGNDLSQSPRLEGKNMTVDINNLLNRLQSFYDFYKNNLKFITPGSNADKYRMMVMLNYSLEGTAYGGDYDQKIGALWIAPNRVQDKKLNCIAHELGHSFQSQITCDGKGEAWGGGGIFEMTSQWMLWQVNPEWTTDENYHWKAFIDNQHRRFLDIENIYHSPYVLEYWAMKHGDTVIADLFREGKRGEDPASTYMRMFNLNIDDMSNEMTDCYSRLVAFDFPRVKDSHKKFTGEISCKVNTATQGKKRIITPLEGKEPQTWGFNVVPLSYDKKEKKLAITFSGTNSSANAAYKTRLVNIAPNGEIHYSDIQSGAKQTYRAPHPSGAYYLIVVGCPATTYSPYTFDNEKDDDQKFKYQITY